MKPNTLAMIAAACGLLGASCVGPAARDDSGRHSSTYDSENIRLDSAEKRRGLPEWDHVSYWQGGGSGEPRIEIDLNRQTASFYRGETLAGVSVASSGREGFDTPPGTFTITQKSPDHRSNLYGDYVNSSGEVVRENVDVRKDEKPEGTSFRGAPMPKFMRFNQGIGMHAGYLPGYPASHGCVRLPPKMADHFFETAGIGTKVVVKR